LATIFLLMGCVTREAGWTGWVYPSTQGERYSIRLTGFDTFEQCRKAATEKLRQFDQPENGTFECGYGCRRDERVGTDVCMVVKN
jgi:hypothetical protein